MNVLQRVELGEPSILEFRGADAVRYLNGQLTQDVRKVVEGKVCLPSCVTDAKGRLQFRVSLLGMGENVLWVAGRPEDREELEARLTRYLIADDVETEDLTGHFRLLHFLGSPGDAPGGVIARESSRYGVAGTDWWIPAGAAIDVPDSILADGNALEALRIANGVPAWGSELESGMLPPEAGLDRTDISYAKGCYIGQEVISRIKSAGKVNRSLMRFWVPDVPEAVPGEIVDPDGKAAGSITSIARLAVDGKKMALGYLKRTAVREGLRLGGVEIVEHRTSNVQH